MDTLSLPPKLSIILTNSSSKIASADSLSSAITNIACLIVSNTSPKTKDLNNVNSKPVPQPA